MQNCMVAGLYLPELAMNSDNKTDLLAQMNSTHLAHDYISSAVSSEQSRVGKLDAMAKRDIYKLRGVSLGVVYSEGKCNFLSLLTRVILFGTMLVVAIVSITAQNFVSRRTGAVLGVFIMLLTGAVLLTLVSVAATRRNDAWGHFYWDAAGKKDNDTTKCPT